MGSELFYNGEVLRLHKKLYPKEEILARVIHSKQFIDKQFHTKLDLDIIVGKSFLSKFYFIRLFKSFYGRTPHQYLIGVRLENAKRLLREGVSVSEVCEQVGFESPSSFTGLFRKYTGLSPSQFQTKSKKQF
ncbi:helix-turn-helix transcriptional regulator [Leptospira sarikeiensis]|uniref:AraC family transcriptional regulator n=1 Tax=Leptospira sarikeiensis TaxID=2484943 RepID=A0A4R9KDQ9_9LEPT|nr:helix-turn-helix transcriptional regulator [Leptospira sarikeiensis]TGL63313.1 AraC family transcriptional regulator [Leptospira sarikeiensis]